MFLILILLSLFIKPSAIVTVDQEKAISNQQLIKPNEDEIVVAVIDSGIDETNTKLKKIFWHNPLDNTVGINTTGFSKSISDENGHGTHIAGIISGVLDKEYYSQIKVMVIKGISMNYVGEQSYGRSFTEAFQFAIDHNAKIINLSFGGYSFMQKEYDAIKKAKEKGILVITAAGNEDHKISNKDMDSYYPASYQLDNIISVGAINEDNEKLPMSNYGKSVNVSAIGQNIRSYCLRSRICWKNGTSQATANVTRIAARLLARNPSLKYKELKSLILKSSTYNPKLKELNSISGEVDEESAIRLLTVENQKKISINRKVASES